MRAHCTGRVTTHNLASAIWPAYRSVEARLQRDGSGGGGMSWSRGRCATLRHAIRAWCIRGAFLLAVAPTVVTAEVAVDGTDFNAFRKKYHCEISQRLAKLQASKRTRDRYLVLALIHHPDRFAQCLFDDSGARVLCEASSGFYTQKGAKPRTFRPSPEAIEVLGRLGFSTDDSQGNFQRQMDTRTDRDIEAVADLLLAAIYEAYGARPNSALEITAPLAPMTAEELARCVPTG